MVNNKMILKIMVCIVFNIVTHIPFGISKNYTLELYDPTTQATHILDVSDEDRIEDIIYQITIEKQLIKDAFPIQIELVRPNGVTLRFTETYDTTIKEVVETYDRLFDQWKGCLKLTVNRERNLPIYYELPFFCSWQKGDRLSKALHTSIYKDTLELSKEDRQKLLPYYADVVYYLEAIHPNSAYFKKMAQKKGLSCNRFCCKRFLRVCGSFSRLLCCAAACCCRKERLEYEDSLNYKRLKNIENEKIAMDQKEFQKLKFEVLQAILNPQCQTNFLEGVEGAPVVMVPNEKLYTFLQEKLWRFTSQQVSLFFLELIKDIPGDKQLAQRWYVYNVLHAYQLLMRPIGADYLEKFVKAFEGKLGKGSEPTEEKSH